ncbi:MAG TPA: ATPase domain-containing protein [Thermoplasmata archaeon]
MAEPFPCPGCCSVNKPDAAVCRVCGRKLREGPARAAVRPPVVLQRVMSGEVFTALIGDVGKGSSARPEGPGAPETATVIEVTPPPEVPIEDNSDVIAAAIDQIRTKAQADGQRFQPYVPGKARPPPTDRGRREAEGSLESAVSLLRDRRFDDAIEPLLKAISRDDEDRRSWILLAEAYLRTERPYKAAVGYLRSLELSPSDEQAWLGLARVLKAIDDLPTAAAVLDRASRINPAHADTWAERGAVLESLQNLSEAMKSFARVLELKPDHRGALAKRQELEAKVPALKEATPEAPASEPTPEADSPAATFDAIPADLLVDLEDVVGPPTEAETPTPGPKSAGPVPTPAPKKAARPPRVRTFVEGLDPTLEGGVPWGHVVLIEGSPGTMKSSLAFSILLQNAAREGLHCLYLSLEERTSSLLKQMGSLGLKLDVPRGSLVVFDPKTASTLLGERPDWIEALQAGIASIQAQRGLDLLAIDSLEALEVLAKFKDRRREMYRLFEWLRDQDLTSFVITERPDWMIAGHVLQGRWDEDFLSDGVIHLRMHMVSDLDAQRRLRVVKMRGTRHETGYLAMVLDDGRFRVTRAMSP